MTVLASIDDAPRIVLDCPVCARRSVETPTCPQCGADLSPLRRVDSWPRQWHDEGRKALAAGRVSQGIDLLSAAVALDPQCAAVHFDLGEAYLAGDWIPEAVARFERALQLSPGLTAAERRCAEARVRLEQRAEDRRRAAARTALWRRSAWVASATAIVFALLAAIPGLTRTPAPSAAPPVPSPLGIGEVRAAFAAAEPLAAIPLQLADRNGVVEVSGTVPSQVHLALVRAIAAQLTGARLDLARINVERPAVVEPQFHVVRPGESLWTIARARYGNGSFWQELWNTNRATVAAPARLGVGQRLSLPPITVSPR